MTTLLLSCPDGFYYVLMAFHPPRALLGTGFLSIIRKVKITIGNTSLPIGRVFKNEFLRKLWFFVIVLHLLVFVRWVHVHARSKTAKAASLALKASKIIVSLTEAGRIMREIDKIEIEWEDYLRLDCTNNNWNLITINSWFLIPLFLIHCVL